MGTRELIVLAWLKPAGMLVHIADITRLEAYAKMLSFIFGSIKDP